MILNASAANGASSFAGRSISTASGLSGSAFLSGSMPMMAGTSSGDGRKSTTASSSGCTPLFLNADPQMTGTNAACPFSRTELFTRLRMAALISASVGSSPCRYFSRILSSASLTFSISCSR